MKILNGAVVAGGCAEFADSNSST